MLGSLEPRDLEMGNLVYTETTATLKVKQHTDELEFIYLSNLLTLPHFKQCCPYVFFTKKNCGALQKKLLSRVMVWLISPGENHFLNKIF